MKERHHYPSTIEEALQQLEAQLSPEGRATLMATPEDDLGRYHFGAGLWMRNNFGLHGQNGALIKELKHALGRPFGVDADDFSAALTELLWERVRGHQGPGVLARGAATRLLYSELPEAWRAAESGDVSKGLAILRDGLEQVRREYENLVPGAPGREQWEQQVVRRWQRTLEMYSEEWECRCEDRDVHGPSE